MSTPVTAPKSDFTADRKHPWARAVRSDWTAISKGNPDRTARAFERAEATGGVAALDLLTTQRFAARLFGSPRIRRYLANDFSGIYAELMKALEVDPGNLQVPDATCPTRRRSKRRRGRGRGYRLRDEG